MQFGVRWCKWGALVALAVALPVAAQDRYAVSADGQEVLDRTTKLSWKRCVEGLKWDGKACKGKLLRFKYREAKTHAADAGSGWRLPTRDELTGIVAKNEKKKPLIDKTAFPDTPNQQFWATRPGSDDDLNAWLVNFSNGRVYGNVGQKRFPLRMVRDAI
jgi:hypothetical protein